jgi:hypothetical protein
MDFATGLKWAAKIAIILVGVALMVGLIAIITPLFGESLTLPTSVTQLLGLPFAIVGHYAGSAGLAVFTLILGVALIDLALIVFKWGMIAWAWVSKSNS